MDYTDYEKAYKQALERAKDLYKQHSAEWSDEDIEYIFPELKEIEDEGVVKEIIDYLKERKSCESYGQYIVRYDRWIAWLEKQGEQKPVDKVEPKFHEGELVVTDKNNVVQIKAIKDSKYVLENTMRFSVDYVDKCWRKWTIQDAKDGDVIVSEDGWICVFKGNLRGELFDSYCFMDSDGWFCPSGSTAHTLDHRYVGQFYPATKEQRDLLFQKMKEAGYEWDAEKKELKKIEQKPAEKVEEIWIPQSGDIIRKKGTTEPTYTLCRKEGIYFSYVQNMDNGIAGGYLSVYSLSDYELVERPKTIEEAINELFKPLMEATNKQKQEWSEEDEKIFATVSDLIWEGWKAQDKENTIPWDIIREWCLSLKRRCKPQQEWSEEDENRFNNLTFLVECSEENEPTKKGFIDFINRLKSLRPQNRCGWNDMSVKPIYPCDILYQQPNGNMFIYRYIEGGRANDAQTPTFCNLDENGKWIYLKDIKPQNTWKPSDEQFRTLENIRKYLADGSGYWNEFLKDFINDLKKL